MTEKVAWFCPSCHRYHAPHCDSCPAVADALPIPGLTVPYVLPVIVPQWHPDTTPSPPWQNPVISTTTKTADPNVIVMGGAATAWAQ